MELYQIGVIQTGGLLWSIISIVAGIIILVFPHVVSYIIAIYLLIVGVLGVISAL